MKPAAILDRLQELGVTVMLDHSGKLMAGPAGRITNEVKEVVAGNRAAIIEALTKKHGHDGLVSETLQPTPAAELPPWCRATCARLDIIQGCGPGCVRSLADGPWRHEWLSLTHMGSCAQSKN